MNEKKLKHLEFIQNIITRMNTNSFAIKGWSITLVSALFALAADKADMKFVLVSFLPVAVLWILDGFFLSQEKQYRKLYEEVAVKTEAAIDFNLNATGYNNENRTWCACLFTKTLVVFHGVLFLVVAVITGALVLKWVSHFICGC